MATEYAKKHSESVSKAFRELVTLNERTAAIVAAAHLDGWLETMLRSYFVDSREEADRILEAEGPVGSFSARIRLAFCLGLLRDDQRRDLHLVRRVRNRAAHLAERFSFEESPVRDWVDAMKQLDRVEENRHEYPPDGLPLETLPPIRHGTFLHNVFHLSYGLTFRAVQMKHREVNWPGSK